MPLRGQRDDLVFDGLNWTPHRSEPYNWSDRFNSTKSQVMEKLWNKIKTQFNLDQKWDPVQHKLIYSSKNKNKNTSVPFLMPLTPSHTSFFTSPSLWSKIKIVHQRLMKIEVTPARLCHGLHCSCSSVSSYLVFLSFFASIHSFFRKGVGCCCSVLPACPNPDPLPAPGRGIESQDHWRTAQVTARRDPVWGWCSGSHWAPASEMNSLEGCWPLRLPSPPVLACCPWGLDHGETLGAAFQSEDPAQIASVFQG